MWPLDILAPTVEGCKFEITSWILVRRSLKACDIGQHNKNKTLSSVLISHVLILLRCEPVQNQVMTTHFHPQWLFWSSTLQLLLRLLSKDKQLFIIIPDINAWKSIAFKLSALDPVSNVYHSVAHSKKGISGIVLLHTCPSSAENTSPNRSLIFETTPPIPPQNMNNCDCCIAKANK